MDVDRSEIVWALVDAVHSLLGRNRDATVPGLGTFRVTYEPSRCDRDSIGGVTIVPPRRTVSFTPEQEDAAVDG